MKNQYYYYSSLLKSKKIGRKVVVIESDDWGSERIPNIKVRDKLKDVGVKIHDNPHMLYDTLESLEDLETLEKLLLNIWEKYGKKIVITSNFNVANPDYSKILNSDFRDYYYEVFTDTYFKRDLNDKVWVKINELMNSGFFKPQFHGREHINPLYWLEELKQNNIYFRAAFDLKCCGIDAPTKRKHLKNLFAALEYHDEEGKCFVLKSIEEGCDLFQKKFKYKSSTFVAPRYVWHKDLNLKLAKMGISSIQTSINQFEPTLEGTYNKIKHFTGETDETSGIKHLVRNAFFEPAYSENIDWVAKTLSNISIAFFLNRPAIVSMHRINFVGGLNEQVRDKNLKQFKSLIEKIIEKYPTVEFLSSEELALLT